MALTHQEEVVLLGGHQREAVVGVPPAVGATEHPAAMEGCGLAAPLVVAAAMAVAVAVAAAMPHLQALLAS